MGKPEDKTAISVRMRDQARADFGARVGWGTKLNIRGNPALAAQFPDGCAVTADLVNGRVVLKLRNRASGSHFPVVEGISSIVVDPAKMDTNQKKIPEFGAVWAESVTAEANGTVVLTMPADLPPKQPYTVRTPRKAKAAPPPRPAPQTAQTAQQQALAAAPTVHLPAAAPVVSPAAQPALDVDAMPVQPAAEFPTEGGISAKLAQAHQPVQPQSQPDSLEEPGVEPRIAMQALNQWKRIMGDDLVITLKDDGGITIMGQWS